MISENKIERICNNDKEPGALLSNDRHGIDRSNLDTSVDPRDNFFICLRRMDEKSSSYI